MLTTRRAERRGGVHHIIPSSRGGGGGDNILPDKRWPNSVGEDHPRWHILAENMRPDEFIRTVRGYINKNGTINERFFSVRFRVSKPWRDKTINPAIRVIERVRTPTVRKRRAAWFALFPDKTVREAIEWIEREFIDKEWLNASQDPISI